MEDRYMFFALVVVALLTFWLSQIMALMRMADDEFVGRYDKPLWAAILIFLSVLGAALFAYWRWQRDAPSDSPDRLEERRDTNVW